MDKYKINAKQVEVIDANNYFKGRNVEEVLEELYVNNLNMSGFWEEIFSENPALNPNEIKYYFPPNIQYLADEDIEITFDNNKIIFFNHNNTESQKAEIKYKSFLQQSMVGASFSYPEEDGEINFIINRIKVANNEYKYILNCKWNDIPKVIEYSPEVNGGIIMSSNYIVFNEPNYIYYLSLSKLFGELFVLHKNFTLMRKGREHTLNQGESLIQIIVPPFKSFFIYSFDFGITPKIKYNIK